MRIAMWSGPRNLSTAMMYSFGARADFSVIDEPFYSAYLTQTGLDHPMRDEILASQPCDPKDVIARLLGPIPDGKPHFYQKHMTQHMIEGVPRDWIEEVTNVILIRHPARVAASFSAKYDNPTLADMGFTQQLDLYEQLKSQGRTPVVVDSAEIRRDPEGMLRQLCEVIGLSWDPEMLSWAKGGHPADGVWAQHWYGTVHRSTGFAPAEGNLPDLSEDQAVLAEAAMPYYLPLSEVALGRAKA
ncbi:MAG: HAD family hydrolase [Roseovarius sp.]